MNLNRETVFSEMDDLPEPSPAIRRPSSLRATSPGRTSSGAASDHDGPEETSMPTVIIIEDGLERRRTPLNNARSRRDTMLKSSTDAEMDFEKSAVYIAENSIEAARISNNYKFGLKKWKSHVTSRPLVSRSEIVQDLYADIDSVKEIKVSTVRPFNILYALLYGWWLALVYAIIGALMYVTVIGASYGGFCWRMARYFIWPFGKYVHQIHPTGPTPTMAHNSSGTVNGQLNDPSNRRADPTAGTSSLVMEGESEPLLYKNDNSNRATESKAFCYGFWKRPSSYPWILFGLIPLSIIHAVIFAISWFFVISIPTAKKCVLSVLAIIPLTYYIGMAITSISAQSSFAVGAILNATFGSMVEVILFIIMLKKGKDSGQECYQELVKSSLTGTAVEQLLFFNP
ncbi:low affinity vacuolar monovalent cation/H(+) antiporter [Elysia marginata]|uniref:Low affinity vacuolar monovalent cation/H(+) antiporter n=1 Tax=Elysia marginata TaxID=1093978 RepID=A0AAV4GRD9_9GAST|nr:low affinity vacuolar monovalent cation/H(+) antiporter [Elysia marginata]